jgi:hypothetical protein
VQTADDPVVVELRRVITALVGTNSTGNLLDATGLVGTNVSSTTTAVNAVDTAVGDVETAVAASNALLNAIKVLTDSIVALQTIAKDQLILLKDQLTVAGLGASASLISIIGGFSPPGGVFSTANNNLLTALNKIVVNTYATSLNTFGIAQNYGRTGVVGALAHGGVIPPHGLALVSEHAPGGGRFMRAGAEAITVTPHSPANENMPSLISLIREVRQLQVVVMEASERQVRAEVAAAEHLREPLDELRGVARDQARETALLVQTPKSAVQ